MESIGVIQIGIVRLGSPIVLHCFSDVHATFLYPCIHVPFMCSCVAGAKGGSRSRPRWTAHSSGLLDNGQSAHSHSRRLPRQPEGTHLRSRRWSWSARLWLDCSTLRRWETDWRSASSQVHHITHISFTFSYLAFSLDLSVL